MKQWWIALLYSLAVLMYATDLKLRIEPYASSFLPGDPQPYWVYNLFDGRIDTCWAEGVKGDGSGTNGSWGEEGVGEFVGTDLSLLTNDRGPVSIDMVRIYNGYGKNSNVFEANRKIKRMGIRVYCYKKEGEEVEEKIYYKGKEVKKIDTSVELSPGWNEIYLEKQGLPTQLVSIEFYINSTYPGTRYDDTCISEIEFFYQGQKYEIVNLEEIKKNTIKIFREDILSHIPTDELPHFIWYDPSSRFAGSLKKMGITHDVHIIEFDRRDGGIYVYRKTRNDYSGEDFTIRDPKTGRVKMNRAVANRIGDWKLSEFSELMVKPLGGKQWEKTTDFRHFSGTFLEGIEYDEEDGMDEILEMGHPGH
ncbi:NADase-type glycan-binding domain-containing protein [Thermospira aquatica]|uniref:NAD glycohydrolase translocation F5/8 type C domain-containing protein n=1 Tax=Thermospira aquatica TaxID=2828656 RepID=A0AAX3BA89_9SPIR|nr:hypothetical protein [Thermospira aquatica]URA09139.1 hypothetical protein KDW03_06415 [Thermospira aquatica]